MRLKLFHHRLVRISFSSFSVTSKQRSKGFTTDKKKHIWVSFGWLITSVVIVQRAISIKRLLDFDND